MLPKPAGCNGCPLYGDGQGFVPDEIHVDSDTIILAQNPGENEENGEKVVDYGQRFGSRQTYITMPVYPAPLIGPTGFLMEREFLPKLGRTRSQVSLCNVLKCRQQSQSLSRGRVIVKRSNDMPQGTILTAAIAHCTEKHLRLPSAKLLIAMGAHAWRFMGGPGSITDWRGFLKPAPPDAPLTYDFTEG